MESMAEVNIVLFKKASKLKLDRPILLAGFPSPGLVGSIAAVHLTQADDFQYVGYIWGDHFAPVAAVHDYSLLPPVRIMASEKKNMVVVLSEISIPLSATAKVAEAVTEVAKHFKAREIGILSSISEGGTNVYFSTNSADMEKRLKVAAKGAKMKEGVVSGVGPLTMIKATEKGLPAYLLMVPSMSSGADSKASSKILKIVSRLYGISIDTTELDKEAKTQDNVVDLEEESGFGTVGMYR